MTGRTDPAGIPLLILVLVPCFLLFTQVVNAEGRRRKRKADRAALEFTRNPDAFERAVRGLYERTLEDLAPSFYQRMRSTLPPPAERLAMAEAWRRAQRVAVLFTDLEQSTPLVERLGDERWFELLLDHNEIMRSHAARHAGRELASAGDGFMFVFDDTGEALIAAIEMQRALASYNAEHDVALSVRMGVHTGEVIRKEDRIIGREVHVAARISAVAAGGQILVSGNVRSALDGVSRFRFGPSDEVTLKGLSGRFEVCEANWSDFVAVGNSADATT
jgi:class 3 adenylate cyclase